MTRDRWTTASCLLCALLFGACTTKLDRAEAQRLLEKDVQSRPPLVKTANLVNLPAVRLLRGSEVELDLPPHRGSITQVGSLTRDDESRLSCFRVLEGAGLVSGGRLAPRGCRSGDHYACTGCEQGCPHHLWDRPFVFSFRDPVRFERTGTLGVLKVDYARAGNIEVTGLTYPREELALVEWRRTWDADPNLVRLAERCGWGVDLRVDSMSTSIQRYDDGWRISR